VSEKNAVTGINTLTEVAMVVEESRRPSFGMRRLSMVGRGYHTEEDVIGFYGIGGLRIVKGKRGSSL
jgi:hypothetical protein